MMGQLRKALSKQNKSSSFFPPPGWEKGNSENWWSNGPAYLSWYFSTRVYQFNMVRHYPHSEHAIREVLRNKKINPDRIFPYQLRQAMVIISDEVAKFGEATRCPICNAPFSSSLSHLVSHVTEVSSFADFGTYWEVPSGASGEKHFRFNPEVQEDFKSHLVGAVSDYYAERIAYGAAKRGVISAIFGA